MLLRSLFVAICLAAQAHAADVALVDDELGQALLISNRGLCYAVLPNHVSPHRDRISLAAPAPATRGTGEIFWRDAQNDLALAYVEGALSTRCSLAFADLPRDLSRALSERETGLIKSVHDGGAFFDRIGAVLIDVDDHSVWARLSDQGAQAEVMQGLSGALLSSGGVLTGIALDAGSAQEARFLRMDRIVTLIGPHLGQGTHAATRAIPKAATGVGFRVTGFQAGDRSGVTSLEAGGDGASWVSAWDGTPVEFEITLSNDRIVPLNKIALYTLTSQAVTPARRIEIEIDRGLPGAPFWTGLAAPDMSPTGVFEAPTGGTFGRRLKIRIMDVWHPDRPLRIDQLVLE